MKPMNQFVLMGKVTSTRGDIVDNGRHVIYFDVRQKCMNPMLPDVIFTCVVDEQSITDNKSFTVGKVVLVGGHLHMAPNGLTLVATHVVILGKPYIHGAVDTGTEIHEGHEVDGELIETIHEKGGEE